MRQSIRRRRAAGPRAERRGRRLSQTSPLLTYILVFDQRRYRLFTYWTRVCASALSNQCYYYIRIIRIIITIIISIMIMIIIISSSSSRSIIISISITNIIVIFREPGLRHVSAQFCRSIPHCRITSVLDKSCQTNDSP